MSPSQIWKRAGASFYSDTEMPKDDTERLTFRGSSFRCGGEFGQATRVNQADSDAAFTSLQHGIPDGWCARACAATLAHSPAGETGESCGE
jgi:hypothetical protein